MDDKSLLFIMRKEGISYEPTRNIHVRWKKVL